MPVQAVRIKDLPRPEPTRARSLPDCPICHGKVVAAEASALRQDQLVQHLWSCDACGYGFVTEGKVVCH